MFASRSLLVYSSPQSSFSGNWSNCEYWLAMRPDLDFGELCFPGLAPVEHPAWSFPASDASTGWLSGCPAWDRRKVVHTFQIFDS